MLSPFLGLPWRLVEELIAAVKFLAARPGDYVEERIVDDMRDVLPPAKMERGFLQVGEPYSHEFDPETGHWRGTFPTFVKEGQNWKYCGNCFIGKTTPPPAPIRR